jgi:hypothetical protein
MEVAMMRTKLITASLLALFIAACGDGNSYRPEGPPPVEMTNIVSIGPITGFGSVVAGGVHYGTGTATVLFDGEPGTLGDLRVGMIVSILGEIDNSTGVAQASEIRFGVDVEGPISSLNPVNSSFVVLGKTVLVDELTVVDQATFDTLAVGNVVRVSGQFRSEERIQATHVHRVANEYQAGMHMHIKGEIENLDIGNQHFSLGGQICDYSGAALELGGNAIANGMYVEVTGTTPMGDGDMILDRIQAKDRDRDRDQLCSSDCDFELEGYVTAFTSATEFEVDGQPVTTTATTAYINGTVATLALDVRVKVDGTLNDDGVLVADRIVFCLPALIEIEASLEAFDANAGTITLLGKTVNTNEFTLFRDHSAAGSLDFGLDDLAVGDWLEVRAYEDTGGVYPYSLMATRVERDDADDSVTLKAPVWAIDRPSIILLGTTATSDEETIFQNAALEVIDADTFFELVEVDDLVKAEGTWDGAAILAEQLFLRDCAESCL